MPSDPSSIIPKIEGKFRSILIFGPPGSGKGTIGRFLSTAGSQCHLSSGDMFRGLSPDSPVGKLHQQYSNQGLLVPDDVTIEIWRYYVHGLIATNRYFPEQQLLLLDGIPRTVEQVHIIEKYIDIKNVIVLDIENKEVLFERMRSRGRKEKRLDDLDDKVLEKRYEVYQTQTAQLLSHFPKDLITTINADQRPLAVLRDILIELSDILDSH